MAEMTGFVRDHYELLGVSRSASAEEIHRAFRVLARRWHPDVSPHPDAGERFNELSRAYEVLHDPLERARYDRDTSPLRRSRTSNSPRRPEFTPERGPDVPRFRDEDITFGLGPIVVRLGAVLRWLS
jgi:curved DNA-binding protein CbpA